MKAIALLLFAVLPTPARAQDDGDWGPAKTPYYVTGGLSGRVGLYGEKENLPAGERVGGGSTGTSFPNSVDANFMGGYVISPDDQISALYFAALRFAQDDADDDSKSRNYLPPDHVVGFTYSHSFLSSLTGQASGSYLDTTGWQDPSFSLSYRSAPGRAARGRRTGPRARSGTTWGLGGRFSLPASDRSQEQGKLTTLGANADVGMLAGRWRHRARLSVSYNVYRDRDDETADESGDDVGGEAYADARTEPVYDETDDWDEDPFAIDLPEFEIGFFARELARTMVNVGTSYRFSRHWNVGIGARVSYSRQETGDARWKSNLNLLSLGAENGGFSAMLAATLTSPKETQDRPTFPDQWGVSLRLSYMLPILGGPEGLQARRRGGFD